MGAHQFKRRLDNGLTLLGERHSQAHTASFALLLPLGAQTDPAPQRGLAGITQELLFKGAGDWNAQALAFEIDRIGFQESHRAEREVIAFSGTVLPQHLPRALEIVFTVLRRPHLPAEGLEEVRQLALHQLQSLEDAPAQKMFYELGQRFFPAPLSNPAEGTLDTIAALRPEDAAACFQRYSPNGAILSVAGAIDLDALEDEVERRFGPWPAQPLQELTLAKASRDVNHLTQDTEQTQIGLAYDGIPMAHPDYFNARVGVLALSGGMSSRLFVEVRQKRGLAYSVFASYLTTRQFGGVLGYAGTTAQRAAETLEVMLQEIRALGRGIDEAELAKAKTQLKTNFIVQGESTRSRAEAMAREHWYAQRVWTLDEVMAAIDGLRLDAVNAYLAQSVPERFCVVTLGREPLKFVV